MKKGNLIKQKNNFLKENYILKVYNENNDFLFVFVGNIKEIERFLRKSENLLLSENILLSKIFLMDLINLKIENKGFIFF